MNKTLNIILKEFFKKCWQIDYVPLLLSCFLLILNLLIGPKITTVMSTGLSILCIFSVLATMSFDKIYMLKLSRNEEDVPELILTRLGFFKRTTLVFALIFYFIGWAT